MDNGGIMSNTATIEYAPISVDQVNWARPVEIAQGERNTHRAQGWMIALGATVVLWSGIGAGIWGIVTAIS